MSREIKFRAWDTHNDTMIDNFLGADRDAWADDSFIKMQFTGRKDKNGTEIYEGDIVKFTQKTNFAEDVSVRTIEVKFRGCGYIPFIWHNECEDGYYSVLVEDVAVVGNVHENPEFLGAGE